MPYFTSGEAADLHLVDDSPEFPWCYLYDSATERWIYIGPPASPRSVIDR